MQEQLTIENQSFEKRQTVFEESEYVGPPEISDQQDK